MTALTLSPAESEELVTRRITEITPLRRPDRRLGVQPMAVVIGGQPGAAKSTVQDLVQAALGPDTAASYEADDDAGAHPRYDAATQDGGIDAHSNVVRSLPPELSQRCLDSLLSADPPYDVVTSAWLETEDRAKQAADIFHNAGHRTVMVYVATNEADSLLAIANRYQQSKDTTGSGRWVDRELHDQVYPGIPDAAHAVEAGGYADDIYVVDRAGNVLYENHRNADGTMQAPLGAKAALIAERDRPPTLEEHQHFVETARSLRARGDELEAPVDDMVRAAMRKQIERPVAQSASSEPVPGTRLDARLAALQHVTGSGVAAPGGIAPPDSSDGARRPGGRSASGQSRER
jgi:hypothetical protein